MRGQYKRSRRSMACSFDHETALAIHTRDRGCIFCREGRWPGATEYEKRWMETAHIVNRSQGGMGKKTNGVAACKFHHAQLDNGNKGWRQEMLEYAMEYMENLYPGWRKEDQVYHKS